MSTKAPMTSSRPYLIRALGEWIVDNHMTPYIVVDASFDGAEVPRQFVENGKIILNIGPYAVRDLDVTNEAVTFSARFSGLSTQVIVPIAAVLAIYARENGQGMVFTDDGPGGPSPDDPTDKKSDKPKLTLVK